MLASLWLESPVAASWEKLLEAAIATVVGDAAGEEAAVTMTLGTAADAGIFSSPLPIGVVVVDVVVGGAIVCKIFYVLLFF